MNGISSKIKGRVLLYNLWNLLTEGVAKGENTFRGKIERFNEWQFHGLFRGTRLWQRRDRALTLMSKRTTMFAFNKSQCKTLGHSVCLNNLSFEDKNMTLYFGVWLRCPSPLHPLRLSFKSTSSVKPCPTFPGSQFLPTQCFFFFFFGCTTWHVGS